MLNFSLPKRCKLCGHRLVQQADQIHYICENESCPNHGVEVSKDDPLGIESRANKTESEAQTENK